LPNVSANITVKAFFEALYRADSRWQVAFDGSDWWSGRAACYPMGEEQVSPGTSKSRFPFYWKGFTNDLFWTSWSIDIRTTHWGTLFVEKSPAQTDIYRQHQITHQLTRGPSSPT
jgi:hypothetical protein